MKPGPRSSRPYRPRAIPMRFEGHPVAPRALPDAAMIGAWLVQFLAFGAAGFAFAAGVFATTILSLALAGVIFGWSGHPGPARALATAALAGLAMGMTYWSVRALRAMEHRIDPGREGVVPDSGTSGPPAPLYDRDLDG